MPIVMHDSSLKRTTGLDRLASELSWTEIAKLEPEAGSARNSPASLCRASSRRSPASSSWDWAAMSRSSPVPAARPRPRASVVETLRRLLAGPCRRRCCRASRTPRSRRPRGCAGVRAGHPDRRARRRLARAGPRRVGAVGINTNGKKLTARTGRRSPPGRLCPQRVHHQRSGPGAGAGRHGRGLRHHRCARRHAATPSPTERWLTRQYKGLRSLHSLDGLSPD